MTSQQAIDYNFKFANSHLLIFCFFHLIHPPFIF